MKNWKMKSYKLDYRTELSNWLKGKNKDKIISLIMLFIASENLEKELFQFLAAKYSKDEKLINIKKKINTGEEKQFLKDLKEYEKDCIALKYAEKADFDLKRDAYHNGDYYLEEFESEFFDENCDIQLFYDYKKISDKYFKQGKFETARKGYETLIKIYTFDGNPENLFIIDKEFEEATLSNLGNVELEELDKKQRRCVSMIKKIDKGDKK